MGSLIPGYNYDIFISYRQKDNKHDGWVTKFVENLSGELESTFKEDISIYFDENPHDRLQETHDVDKSLEGKLKCLIFIPILSQTYCDPQSYAWQYEFQVFNKFANEDRYGKNIRLRNGNYASRILTIRIHDLEPEDVKLFEKETGNILRSMDFVFKTSSGVNRPLQSNEDRPNDNLNKTLYRDQVNKVAHEIKEIILGIKSGLVEQGKEKIQERKPFEEFIKGHNNKKDIGKDITSQKSKKWLIALLSVALCIIGAFAVFKIIDSSKNNNDKAKLEKSIAVLPFKSLSDDPVNKYLADGMVDAITLHLSKINGLRVMSRTSGEQYSGTTKTIRTIGKELDVDYLLEGSFQKFGDDVKLIVQLINASEESHEWAEEYNNKWSNIFSLQSEIAKKIAISMSIVISPVEERLIDKTPTTNLMAYDFYLRGLNEQWKHGTGSFIREDIEKAEYLFKKALEYDSTFALGYVGIGYIYWKKAFLEPKYSKIYMDSMLAFANIALSYDNNTADAFILRAGYYAGLNANNTDQPLKELDEAIKINPNLWGAYHEKAKYYNWRRDLIGEIENRQKAISLNHGAELPELLYHLGNTFLSAGFLEKGQYHWKEALSLEGDSLKYLYSVANMEFYLTGNYNKSLECLGKIHDIDPKYSGVDRLFTLNYLFSGQFEKSLNCLNGLKAAGLINQIPMYRIAYIYWINGNKKEAEYYFNKSIEDNLGEIRKSNSVNPDPYYSNACIYAVKGDKNKAVENLKIYSQDDRLLPLLVVSLIKNDPYFNSIRNEPEFQKIVNDMEAKYQAEHDMVRKWMEERGEL